MKRLIVLFCLWPLLVFANPPQSQQAAEINRLRELLSRHYKNETWAGVDNVYIEMVELNKRSTFLIVDDHLKGAMASSSLGNIEETISRLDLALMVEETTSASQWKDNLENNTGEISLTSEIEQELLVLDGLYLPEMVQAVVFANQQLNENGYFNGRLPKGSYVYGELHFDIVPNEEKVFAVRKEETPKRNEKRSKKRLEKAEEEEEEIPTIQEERGQKDLLVMGATFFHWGVSKEGEGGPIPFSGGGFLMGWERSFFNGPWLFGVNPNIQLVGYPNGGVLGLLPSVYVGLRSEEIYWTIGGVQQTYIFAGKGFVMADGQTLPDYVDSGFSFGWGGQTRVGVVINDRYDFCIQGILGGDGIRWMYQATIGLNRTF